MPARPKMSLHSAQRSRDTAIHPHIPICRDHTTADGRMQGSRPGALPRMEKETPVKKVVLLGLLFLALTPIAYATCNIDIIDEFITPFQVGVPGSFTFTPCCGTPPYTFTLYAGPLPPGLTLSAGGTISGTPTTAGESIICV